jgi:hypothetical protein
MAGLLGFLNRVFVLPSIDSKAPVSLIAWRLTPSESLEGLSL